MKPLMLICNFVLFGFTCLVLAVDGAPEDPAYIALTLLLLIMPAASVFAMVGTGGRRAHALAAGAAAAARAIGIVNIGLFILICVAIVDRYPHPREQGLLAFVALALLTPILNAFMLLRRNGDLPVRR